MIAVVVLIVGRIVSSRYPVEKDVDLVHWTPAGQATAAAMRLHRQIFYEFSAEWCGPCHQLEREVFMDPMMAAEINNRFIAVKVVDRQREDGRNIPSVQQIIDRYGVTAFPTVVIAAADGKVRERTVGYSGSGPFMSFLFHAR